MNHSSRRNVNSLIVGRRRFGVLDDNHSSPGRHTDRIWCNSTVKRHRTVASKSSRSRGRLHPPSLWGTEMRRTPLWVISPAVWIRAPPPGTAFGLQSLTTSHRFVSQSSHSAEPPA
ncbi:hypothetical protein DQ04_23921000 [Trypanosoma grayi]|uniref:hypothetical protein n=1 Tax=Trypanosoma grayi TaxID=71804 RepID=UPI0004F403D1|nr:hypothetical protein DQ04_23921000 [Trypanosoma grayi]KEG05295.1 hypothetical protein DQ04_23921000 [Trypanosoma grayi]